MTSHRIHFTGILIQSGTLISLVCRSIHSEFEENLIIFVCETGALISSLTVFCIFSLQKLKKEPVYANVTKTR